MAQFVRCLLVAAVLMLVIPFAGSATATAPQGEPIVFGYVGYTLSPGTRPCMEIQRVAVEEINQAGGILGRPVRYVTADNKGQTTLTIEGARHLLRSEGVIFLSVEGRSEIALAAQENSAVMFKDYPHLLILNGTGGLELTDRVVDDYERYRFTFRDWEPLEPSHYAQQRYIWEKAWPRMVPDGKRVAILWEDLNWNLPWRTNGIPSMDLPPWPDFMEELGLEVVFNQNVAPRGTMYLPVLQQIARAKADHIFFVSSWFTDTESFVKQWADSAARNTLVHLYAGVSQTDMFWNMTGGRALGVVSNYMSIDVPITEKTVPFYELAKKHGIPTQLNVHLAYADIYFFKAVIEKAGGIDDIDTLIQSMYTTETTYSLGKMVYETQRIKPFFHCRKRVDPTDPSRKSYPGVFYMPWIQYQHDGKVQYLHGSTAEHEDFWTRYGMPEDLIMPEDLRKR
ncbi:MAG TPA: hypothetical protein ENN35_03630 [Deltaproteobacteria bacterium]|nr:hypothetical protein [Deltaproteobacteria bacterium]